MKKSLAILTIVFLLQFPQLLFADNDLDSLLKIVERQLALNTLFPEAGEYVFDFAKEELGESLLNAETMQEVNSFAQELVATENKEVVVLLLPAHPINPEDEDIDIEAIFLERAQIVLDKIGNKENRTILIYQIILTAEEAKYKWMVINPNNAGITEEMIPEAEGNLEEDLTVMLSRLGYFPAYPGDIIIGIKTSQIEGSSYYLRKDLDVLVNLKIINLSSSMLPDYVFPKKSKSNDVDMTNTFGGVFNERFKQHEIQWNVTVTVRYTIVQSLDEVGANDHVMMIVDNIPKGARDFDILGLATISGRISAVEVSTFADGTWTEVARHELGHNFGLRHLEDDEETADQTGLMNKRVNGSIYVSNKEKIKMWSTRFATYYREDGTFKADGIRGNSPQKAKKFLERNNIVIK